MFMSFIKFLDKGSQTALFSTFLAAMKSNKNHGVKMGPHSHAKKRAVDLNLVTPNFRFFQKPVLLVQKCWKIVEPMSRKL